MEADDDPEVVTLPNDAGYVAGRGRSTSSRPPRRRWPKSATGSATTGSSARHRTAPAPSPPKSPPRSPRGCRSDKAVAEAGVPLAAGPADRRRGASRSSQANADAVAPLRMLFTLTQGKSRMVADPQGRGFFIVKTNKITPGNALQQPGADRPDAGGIPADGIGRAGPADARRDEGRPGRQAQRGSDRGGEAADHRRRPMRIGSAAMTAPRILVVDNVDSFTFMLVDYLVALGRRGRGQAQRRDDGRRGASARAPTES